jgi:hypothetical protein
MQRNGSAGASPSRVWCVAIGAALVLAVGPVWADAPKIDNLSPLGVVRGSATEVLISGGNLAANPQVIAAIPIGVEPGAGALEAGKWPVKLLVPAEVPLGVYPIRIKTDDGISNPFLLAVGQLVSVAEKEDNTTFEQAQAVTIPCVVEGTVSGNDVDYFKFAGVKGQRIVVDAQCARIGSGVDPQIRLTTLGRKFVEAADDTPGLLTDAMFVATLPADGEYVVELSDSKYQGAGRAVYRLTIGAIPYATDVFPMGGRRGETVGFELRGGTIDGVRSGAMTLLGNGTHTGLRLNSAAMGIAGFAGPAGPLDVETLLPIRLSDEAEIREPADPSAPAPKGAVPGAFNGRIDPAGDEDVFKLAVVPGQKIRIRVEASELGSALDGTLQIRDAADNGVLAAAEDTVIQPAPQRRQRNAPGITLPDPSIDFTVPANKTELLLSLKDLLGRGGVGYGYRIEVEPVENSFAVIPADPQISIPKGGTVAVPVTLMRYGFNGPVTVGLQDPPAGVTFRAGVIPAGQVVGVMSVSAAADANFGAVTLKLNGMAEEGARKISVIANKPIQFAAVATLPTKIEDQEGLMAAPMAARPIVLEAPESIEAVHGLSGTFVVKANRQGEENGALALTPVPLSGGIQIPNVNIAEKMNEATATVNVAVEAPFEAFSVAMAAKGKIGDHEQTIYTPAVKVTLIRPVDLALETKAVEIKQGATVEVKGKVERKGGLKEAITVKIEGLPAGLKAEPATVAPEASDYVINIVADGNAAEAMATAKVSLAFKAGGKDYPFPQTDLPVKVVK